MLPERNPHEFLRNLVLSISSNCSIMKTDYSNHRQHCLQCRSCIHAISSNQQSDPVLDCQSAGPHRTLEKCNTRGRDHVGKRSFTVSLSCHSSVKLRSFYVTLALGSWLNLGSLPPVSQDTPVPVPRLLCIMPICVTSHPEEHRKPF